MPRYIDAEKIEFFEYPTTGYFGNTEVTDYEIMVKKESIDKMPTISPDDVMVLGKWEKETTCYSRCSNCKKLIKTSELVVYKASDGQGDFLVVPSIEEYDFNYCPNCGAKMEVSK